jgi:hypothetical protein
MVQKTGNGAVGLQLNEPEDTGDGEGTDAWSRRPGDGTCRLSENGRDFVLGRGRRADSGLISQTHQMFSSAGNSQLSLGRAIRIRLRSTAGAEEGSQKTKSP